MYIRRRKNKSGTTSIFIAISQREAGKKHPQTTMIKSFGSSADPNEVEELLAQATRYKDRAKQLYKKFTPLSIRTSEDIEACKIQSIGIKQVYGEVFDRHFGAMKTDRVNHQLLRDLVLMRIAEPVSKLKTAAIADDFGISNLSINKIYKMMDTLSEENIDKIKYCVYQNSKQLLNNDHLEVLFYDLTTIYFENNTSGDLKEFGFSKDGKSQHVQISLALVVTEFGLPIGYEIFKGNIYEGKTLLPVLNKLRGFYRIDKVTIVADSAMLSSDNLEQLTKNNFHYIVAARIKNVKKALGDQVLVEHGYTELNDDLRYKIIKLDSQSLIACYSKKRARKDQYDRELTLKNIEKFIGTSAKGKLRGVLKKPYVTLSKQSIIEIDRRKLEESKLFDGYFGFYTNTDLSAEAVVTQYRGLWQVEQSFRIAKHNLAIRPVYHYTDRRIKAHFAICFLALALVRTVEHLLFKAGHHVAAETLHQLLQKVKTAQIISGGQTINIMQDLPEEVHTIYRKLNISLPRMFAKSAAL